MIKYKFYATLLDSFQNYIDLEEIYEKFYGFSDTPKFEYEEFKEKEFRSLIDKINRVPFESEAADRGTAFNEIIDRNVSGKIGNSDILEERIFNEENEFEFSKVTYKGKVFEFKSNLINQVSTLFKDAIIQKKVVGILETRYGDVELYGYTDYIMPFMVHDLKTTAKYNVGKYKKNWQHIVYPYCLIQNECYINSFEYNIIEFSKNETNLYKENYTYNEEIDKFRLRLICEGLIDFLEENKSLITDKKIFNLE